MFKIPIIERIKRLPKQTEESLGDVFDLLMTVEDRKSVDHYVRWVRSEAQKIRSAGMYDLIRRTYMFAGQYRFDDFMIAMEWNREPKARFWLPRRKVLEGKHGIATKIQNFMDDPEALFLGFSQPPGTGKTTIIKFLLAYIIGKEPKSANMYISYSDGMTKMLLDSVKSMLTDRQEYCFHEIFPALGEPSCSAEYKTISYRRAGDFPTLGLVSMSGSVTGRTRANRFLVTDDLVKNKEEARSPERLDKLFSDYTATLTTRMIGDHVKQIMLGTRWSAYDPLGRMEEAHGDDPRYTFIAIPVWDENEVSNFEYEHPDRYTTEKIRDIKSTIDSADFECLFMQHGIEKEGLAFPADSLRYYNGVLPDGEPDNICFANDVAWGGGDSLSMPVAFVYGEDVYIHDWIFDRRDKSVTKPRVIGKILAHKIKMGQTEANNGGEEYSDDVYRILRQDYGYSINMSHKKAPTNMAKLTRIEQHAPTIRNFYFRERDCWDDDYRKAMNELTGFSFTSKNIHDDAADSLAMLAGYIFGGQKIVTVAKRPF
jgi:predicted phage terminase large subunit-like protein